MRILGYHNFLRRLYGTGARRHHTLASPILQAVEADDRGELQRLIAEDEEAYGRQDGAPPLPKEAWVLSASGEIVFLATVTKVECHAHEYPPYNVIYTYTSKASEGSRSSRPWPEGELILDHDRITQAQLEVCKKALQVAIETFNALSEERREIVERLRHIDPEIAVFSQGIDRLGSTINRIERALGTEKKIAP